MCGAAAPWSSPTRSSAARDLFGITFWDISFRAPSDEHGNAPSARPTKALHQELVRDVGVALPRRQPRCRATSRGPSRSTARQRSGSRSLRPTSTLAKQVDRNATQRLEKLDERPHPAQDVARQGEHPLRTQRARRLPRRARRNTSRRSSAMCARTSTAPRRSASSRMATTARSRARRSGRARVTRARGGLARGRACGGCAASSRGRRCGRRRGGRRGG